MSDFDFARSSIGAVASAGSSQAAYPPINAIDGSDVTFWGATVGVNTWWKVDLGSRQYITRVELAQLSTGWCTDPQFSWSDDDVTYASLPVLVAGNNTVTQETGGVWGRYWKVTYSARSGTGGVRFTRVSIIGPVDAPPPPVVPTAEQIDVFFDALQTNLATPIAEYFALRLVELDTVWQNVFALLYYIAQRLTAPTVDVSLDLSPVLAALGDVSDYTISQKINNTQTIMGTIYTDLWNGQVGIRADISDAKGEVLTDAGVKELHVISHVDAIDAASTQDVTDARDYLDGQLNLAQAAIIGDVDSKATEVATAVNAHTDTATSGIAGTVNGHTDAVQTALSLIINAVAPAVMGSPTATVASVLAALAAFSPVTGAPKFPGWDKVNLGTSYTFTGIQRISGPMDGLLFQVSVFASGQSKTLAFHTTRVKGAGWCTFVGAYDYAEPLQKIEVDAGLLTPQSMLQAVACEVYTKPGTVITVTPYTIKP